LVISIEIDENVYFVTIAVGMLSEEAGWCQHTRKKDISINGFLIMLCKF
jgi:hypothetical protein